jgi:multidrug resistance efflux pump
MSALAPVEVAPREPFIVTSGVDGVIRSVAVAPGQSVKRGETLVVLEDTVLKNRAEVAEREAAVAETKYKKAAQLAFADVRGRHEMAVARSELELRLAERNFARELLERSRIKAERDGVALFADRKDLVGRPVTVGEKLMEIAQVAPVEFLIDLPVADAITLVNGARAKIFLDSDPLRPIEARLVRAAYRATSRDGQPLAFRLVAQAEAADATVPRLGVRGTAQVYSDTVALGFYLLRRPIAAARQWSGL